MTHTRRYIARRQSARNSGGGGRGGSGAARDVMGCRLLSVEASLPRFVAHEEGDPEPDEFLVHAEVALVSARAHLEGEVEPASLVLGHEPRAQRERALVDRGGAAAEIGRARARQEVRPLEQV